MEIITAIIVLIISIIAFSHLRFKPLSEDDGNWYYLATFWKKGLRPYKISKTKHFYERNLDLYLPNAYWCLQLFLALIYNYLIPAKTRSYRVIPFIKIGWYSLTSLALFGFLLLHNQALFTSFVSTLIFIYILSCTKKIWSDLTYAEIFLILPLLLSFIFFQLGLIYSVWYFYFISGFLATITFQFKIISLPVLFFYFFIFSFKVGMFASLIVALSFALFNLLPFLFFFFYKNNDLKRSSQNYYISLFSPLFTTISYSLKLKTPCKYKKSKSLNNNYIINNIKHQTNAGGKKRVLSKLNEQLLHFPLVYFLSICQFLLIIVNFSLFKLFLIISLFSWLIVIVAQHKTYKPVFNSVWFSISSLAGITIGEICLISNLPVEIKLIILMGSGIAVHKWYKNLKFENRPKNRETLNGSAKKSRIYAKLPEIAEYIRENSLETDRILFWGNFPNFYIYSERRSFYSNLFLYPVGKIQEDAIYNAFKFWNAPLFILFCPQAKERKWDINTINYKLRTNYKIVKTYNIGTHLPRSYLLKLDTKKYKDLVWEQSEEQQKFTGTLIYKEKEWKEHIYRRVLQLKPNDVSAKFKLEALQNNYSDKTQLKELNQRLQNCDNNTRMSHLLYLKAEILTKKESFEEALTLMEKALSFNKSDYKIFNLLGEILFNLSAIEDALINLMKANELNPFSSKVFSNLAVVLFNLGDLKKAKKCAYRAVNLAPYNKSYLNNLNVIRNHFTDTN